MKLITKNCVATLKSRAILVACTLALAGCARIPFNDSLSFVLPAKNAAQTPVEPETLPKISVGEFEESDNSDAGELRFQPGDTMKVALWGYPELDHVAIVQPNGKVTLPLVGEIPAAEATAAELRERVNAGLAPYTRINSPGLRPGDVLHFMVWHDESLRHAAVVDPNGDATFPLVGTMHVTDRPLEEVRAEAEKKVGEYVREAKVSIMPAYQSRRVLQDYTVSVLSQIVQPRRIAVIGEVGIMGLSDLKPGARVIDALAQHQLRSQTAAMNSVVVIRNPTLGKPRYRVVRLQDFLEGLAPQENIVLRNGDIVIVPKTTIAKVGDFVDLFFSRTLPVFQWWGTLWESTVSRQKADTVRLINESLERNLNQISINPTPPR